MIEIPRCCSGSSCACSVQAGTHITIAGTGAAQDPFVIGADVALDTVDTAQFALSQTGSGTVADPWVLQVNYATTAKFDNLPDVNVPSPTNGQVVGWDSATSKFTMRAPTTAASGSVLTDTTIEGDGSSGTPLGVTTDPAGFLEGNANGVALTSDGKNQMVLHYADAATRAVSTLVPHVNSLSTLDDTPGVTWYWTGTQWLIVNNAVTNDMDSEFLQLSGAYSGGPTTLFTRTISFTTNSDGTFDALSTADVSGAAGVLSVIFQEAGVVPFKAVLRPTTDHVLGTAYRLDDGTAYGSQSLSGVVVGYLY